MVFTKASIDGFWVTGRPYKIIGRQTFMISQRQTIIHHVHVKGKYKSKTDIVVAACNISLTVGISSLKLNDNSGLKLNWLIWCLIFVFGW